MSYIQRDAGFESFSLTEPIHNNETS